MFYMMLETLTLIAYHLSIASTTITNSCHTGTLHGAQQRSHGPDFEKNYYESLLIVLDTLEKCLSSQPKDTTRDEAMNVKILLRETCQFIGGCSQTVH